MPSFAARSASRAASSTESRSMPGIEGTATRVFEPSTRNSGQIRSSAVSTLSATSRRFQSALRLRRGRMVRSSGADVAAKGGGAWMGAWAAAWAGGGRTSIGRPYWIGMAALLSCGAICTRSKEVLPAQRNVLSLGDYRGLAQFLEHATDVKRGREARHDCDWPRFDAPAPCAEHEPRAHR